MSELPQGWTWSTLQTACAVVRGITFPATAKEPKPTDANVCCLRTSNIQKEINWNDVYYVNRSYVKREDQLVQPGDVLMSMANSYELVGKVAKVLQVPSPTAFGAFLSAVRPTPAVNGNYLFHFLRTDQVQSELREGSSQTTNIANISVGRLSSIAMPLAPEAEQTRIANQLDTLLARVQACNDRFDAIPALLKRFRQTIYMAAISGRLTEDWRAANNARDWTHERAADVCAKVQSGGTPKEGFSARGVPFLKVYNIVNQKVAFDYKPQYIESSIHHGSMAKSRTQPGDVLMNIVGPPLGKVAIVPADHDDWNINQAITLFRPSDRISTGWLYCILCSGVNIADIIHETRGSAGQVNISLSQCRDFVFPVPTVVEQAQIVRRVEALFALADRIEARCTAARAQTQRLTPLVLAKAFRGELVPQDPTDEPASALLARIASTNTAVAGKNKQKVPVVIKELE